MSALLDPRKCDHAELTTETSDASLRCNHCGTTVSISEAIEYRALQDLQWRRSRQADELWRRAHPDRGDVWPDLGELLSWLLEQIGRPGAAQVWYAERFHALDCGVVAGGDCSCGWWAELASHVDSWRAG